MTIAGGRDDLKGKIFRLGHCGWLTELDDHQLANLFALEDESTQETDGDDA